MINNRYSVGLVAANICDPFSNRVAKGVMTAAEELDVNLIIAPVKYIGNTHLLMSLDAQYEYMYNALLSHISSQNLDYLIVCTGSIAYSLTKEQMKNILDSLGNTPVLSLAAEIDGYEHLVFDNQTGIKAAVSYLIKTGRKRIGMMRGTANNNDCIERFEAYRQTLEENGIAYDEKLTIFSDISDYCEDEAEKLITENPDMDAVVCINDAVARTVYKVLNKHRIRIGKDIAVTGFDDLPFAQHLNPPLASIKADAEMLGYRAMKRAFDFLTGNKAVPELEQQCVATSFIPRESCENSMLLPDYSEVFCKDTDECAKNIIKYVFSDYIPDSVNAQFFKNLTGIISTLKKVFFMNEIDINMLNTLTEFFENIFNNSDTLVQNSTRLLQVCDLGFRWLMNDADKNMYDFIAQLYSYLYQKITYHLISGKGTGNINTIEINHRSNIITRDILMFDTNDEDTGYASMLRKIHNLSISTGYLYILDKPLVYHDGEIFPTDVKWLLKAYHFGSETFSVPKSRQEIAPQNLFKNEFLPPERRYTYIMADLYSSDVQYGFALFEMPYEYFDYFEYLTYQVSAAVKILGLIKTQEETLAQLHATNLTLQNMSTLDELTGSLNRRGFYRYATEQFEQTEGKLTVIFADLDDLKMINDTFGHSEGDIAIKTIADCLREVISDSGIVGRVGGDEFVAMMPSRFDNMTDYVQKKCADLIERSNIRLHKPYKISMSMGIFECETNEFSEISEVIDKADYLLYVQKRKKKEHRNTLF